MSNSRKQGYEQFCEKIVNTTFGRNAQFYHVEYKSDGVEGRAKYDGIKERKSESSPQSLTAVAKNLAESISLFLIKHGYNHGMTNEEWKTAFKNLSRTTLDEILEARKKKYTLEDFPFFFAPLGLYGSLTSIAAHIATKITDIHKIYNLQGGNLSEQDDGYLARGLYQRLLRLFPYILEKQKSKSPYLIWGADVFGENGLLHPSLINVRYSSLAAENFDEMKHFLEAFVLSVAQKGNDSDPDDEDLKVGFKFLKENCENVISLAELPAAYKNKHETEKAYLNMAAMIQLAALSGAISHFTFADIPSAMTEQAVKAKKGAKKSDEDVEEDQPKKYGFCESTASDLAYYENSEKFIEHTHVLSFKPFSRLLKGKSEQEQIQNSIAGQMFKVFRGHAGLKTDGTSRAIQQGRSTTLRAILEGTANLGIDELAISDKNAIKGFTKANLDSNVTFVRFWSNQPDLSRREAEKLLEFFENSTKTADDFINDNEIKSLVMKMIYAKGVVKNTLIGSSVTKKGKTAEEKSDRLDEINNSIDKISTELVDQSGKTPRFQAAAQRGARNSLSFISGNRANLGSPASPGVESVVGSPQSSAPGSRQSSAPGSRQSSAPGSRNSSAPNSPTSTRSEESEESGKSRNSGKTGKTGKRKG